MKTQLLPLALVVTGGFAIGWPAVSAAASDFSAVAIFATNSVEIKQDADILSGDVVVNDFSNGPTLAGAELTIDRLATVVNATADSIVLARGAVISGSVACNALDSSGVQCFGLSLPVFSAGDVPPLQQAALRSEAEDVVVEAGVAETLDAGDYADIILGNGAAVIFTGGVYNIGSIQQGSLGGGPCQSVPCRALVFEAPTELRILGRLDMGKNAFIGPAPGSQAVASSIMLYVGGTNFLPEDPSSVPSAATVGRESTIEANIYAANGTVHLDRGTVVTGALLGRDVWIERDVQVHLASFFNPPPTAEAQDVFTKGTDPLGIELTGSDPEDETLTFTIVSGPWKGTLSAVTQVPPTGATVTYTADPPGDLADSFTFRVTDPNGGFDEAVVSINVVDTSEEPPAPSNTVVGIDMALEALKDTELPVTLSGFPDVADPTAVGDLEFSIVSGPSHGSLTPVSPTQGPEPVRTAQTTYEPEEGFEGSDGFVFEVCGDLTGDGDTDDLGECDTATVSITVDVFSPPPSPQPPAVKDQTVTTQQDTPVEINLSEQAGGGLSGNLVAAPRGAGVDRSTGERATELAEITAKATGVNLTVTSFAAPTQASLGEVIGDRIQVTVTNTGTVDIPAGTDSDIGFYISTDSVITTADTLLIGGRENLATSAPNGLAVGESIQDFLFAGASINPDSPEGEVFIGVLADEYNDIEESDETDNTAVQGILIGPPKPDLVVSSLTHAPAAPNIETQIDFTAVVENIGIASAGASWLCFEIGGESCFTSPGDTLFAVPPLEPEETFTVTRSSSLPAGSYQNTAVADFKEEVDESDENNNTAIDTFTVSDAFDGLFATITVLPQVGTLFDQTGDPIPAAGAIAGVRVTYVPPAGFTGSTFFQFTLTDSSTDLTSVVAQVDLTITGIIDPCVAVGREPGCAPSFP